MMKPSNRWIEIISLWRQYQYLYGIAGFLLGLLFFPLLQMMNADIGELLQGLIAEAIGIAFTVFLIDAVYQRRERDKIESDLRNRLIREMGSLDNATAINATRELRDQCWLLDGSLKGINIDSHADLSRANLENASLAEATMNSISLQHANLSNADLQSAWLIGTRLQNAILHKAHLASTHLESSYLQNAFMSYANAPYSKFIGADLTQTILQGADLQGADLRFTTLHSNGMHEVNLRGTDFSYATLIKAAMNKGNLQSANFTNAKLQGVWLNDTSLAGAIFHATQIDEETYLPDGTLFDPKIGLVQLERFTDINHPEFWQPDWIKD